MKIFFNGACTGTTVKVALPLSVAYIPGSILKTAGASGLGISESSIADLRNPVFSIGGTVTSGDEITFTLDRKAECGTLTTGKDSIFVTTGGGCFNTSDVLGTRNTYNILSPSLSINPPPSLTGAVIDTTATRISTIINGGNGVTDTLRFFIVYPGGGIINTSGSNAITANTVSFTPYRTSVDTLFYKIFGSAIFGGDSILNNGETVNIAEPIKVLKCNATTNYGVAWGRNDSSICAWSYANVSVIAATGAPNFNLLTAAQIGFVDKCTPYDYEMTFYNGGLGNRKAATMYDLKIQQGHWASSVTVLANMDTSLFSISNFRIGTASLSFTYVGGIINIDLNNLISSDPDGAGIGIEDIDGDGYYDDLPPGQSIKLAADIEMKCNRACGVQNYNYSVAAILKYRTMCSSSISSSDVKLSSTLVNYLYETAFYGKSYIPANVIDGIPFRINLKAGFSVNQDSYSSSSTRYRWKMILPLGFSVAATSNPRYGLSGVSYTLSGDTVIFTSGTNSLDSFSINLVYSCGSNGTKTINYTLEKINNISTGCKCQGDLICASVTTHAFCPMPCPNGPTTYVPKVKRSDSCIGWTDYTIRTRVDPLMISGYDLSKALYLDTINIYGSALQNDPSLNLFFELTLPKTTIAPTGVNKLTPIQTKASFYRTGVLINSCVLSTFSTTATTASTQSVVYDLSSCVLAMGGLSVGDSIEVVSSYVVATNNNLPKNDVQSGGTWTFYNKDAAGLKVFCNTTVPEMYLVGTDLVNATNAYITGGCAGTTLGGNSNYLARRFNTAGELFKNEFRPVMYIDSIVALMPSGYIWNYTHFQPAAGPVFNFLSPTVVGNRYSFVNPGTWQALGLTITNAYGGYVPFNVSPVCGTLLNENINFKIYIRDYYYAYANKSTPSGLAYVLGGAAGQTRTIAYTASQKPDIDLIDQTGIVPAIKDSLNWNLRIYNKGLNAANYTWIAIPYNPSIAVNKVTEIATGTILSPIAYGGGYWYKLGTTGIAAGSSKDYKIDFNFNSCVSDSLEVFAGWNCGAYPADPTSYPCTSILDRIALKVAAVPSEVQLSVLREPGGGGTVDLCKTDSILLVVNSAQTANLKEPYLVIYPPLGFTVSSTIKVEYPLGSGNYQSAIVSSISGGGIKIDLTSHSGIGLNGLLGTATSSSSYVPLGGDRQAKVKLDYTTDCDLTSGYSFVFYAYGKMPCGQAALGNGVSASTTALNITGATTGGIAGATLGISAGSLSCGSSTAISFTSTPTGMPTQLGDTMMYILPSGLKYDSSFVKGANCDSCKIKIETGTAGTTVVKVKLQTGVSAATALSFSFNVKPKASGCGSVTIPAYFKRNISALMCDTVLCSNSSIFLATYTSAPISVKKPNIQINSYELLDTNIWLTGTALNKIKVKYSNTGTLAYSANVDSIELFCGASASPFAILPLTKALAIGAVDSDIYFLSIPSFACSDADLVTTTAKIRITTVNGTEQCLCDTSFQRMSVKPTVGPALTYCQWSIAPPLTATGTSLKWYTVPTGGLGSTTAIVPGTSVVGVKSYYVSQTSSIGVEGPRAEIKVTVLRTPEAPVVSTPFEYCQGASALVLSATKVVSSDTLLWYASSTGTAASYSAPIPSTSTSGSFFYFVGAKSNLGCEGPRDSIEVIVNPKPAAPIVVSPVKYCIDAVTTAINATPVDINDTLLWYNSAIGGTLSYTAPTPSTSAEDTFTYWVSAKTSLGCEGPRDSIDVIVFPNADLPLVVSPIAYCIRDTAIALSAIAAHTTDTLLWYTSASGGLGSKFAPTPSTSTSSTSTYWVSAKTIHNCEGLRDSIKVNVNPSAGIPRVTSPINYCSGAVATALSAIKSSSTDTLLWYTSAVGGVASYSAPIPSTSVVGMTTYYVSGKSSLGCEGRRESIDVKVNSLPDLPLIVSPVIYCKGETSTVLSASAPLGDTILWYSSSSGGASSIVTPIPNTSLVGTTKYYVGAKNSFGCIGPIDSIVVTINPLAAKPIVSTPITYCQGATASVLTATKSLASDTLLWYTSASGGTGITTAPTPSTSSVGTTTYWVSAKSNLNCEGQRDSINVVVNRTPSKPIVTTPITYCQGATASVLTATKSLVSDTLLWYTSASGGTGITTAPTPSTSSVGTTTYWVSAKSNLNCEGQRDSINVVVNRTPSKPIVTTPITYCQGATASVLTATKSLVSDTLLWYTSASGGTGITTAPTPSTSSVGTTTYWVSAKSNLNCEGQRDSINVVVNRTPSKPIVTTPITYCQGATASVLTATKSLVSDTLLWYTSASSGTGSAVAPIPSTATAGNTTYWVSAKSNLNCEGQRDSINVVVNRTPSKPTVTTPITYCQGAIASVLTAVKSLTSDTLLWYTSASGGTGSTTAPTPSTATAGTTTYWVSAKSNLNCEGQRDSTDVVVNRTPNAPAVASPVVYCQWALTTALIASKSAISDTLLWYTSSSGGVYSLIAPTPIATSTGITTYWVSAKSILNCEGQRDSINVMVNATPTKPTVVSPISYCLGATASALTATKLPIDTLLWYPAATGGTPTRIAPVPSTAIVGTTTYWVSVKNAPNCEGPRDSINVVVNPMPVNPIVITPVVYCQGEMPSALSATKAASDSLLWYSSATGGVGVVTAPVPSSATAGTTTFWLSTKTVLNCESPRDSINVVVNRTPAKPFVTSPVVYCQGAAAVPLMATKSIATDTLLWYSSAIGGIGSPVAPIPSTAIVGTTTYWVSAKSNLNCEGVRDSINVVVNRTPAKPIITTPMTYCQGATAVPLMAAKSIASDTLLWYTSASGGTGSTTAPTPSTAGIGTITYWVSAKSNLNCEGTRDSIQVVVNRTPAKPTVISPIVYCQGATSALTATKAIATDTLLWYTTAIGGSGTTIAPTPSTAVVGTTTYWVSAKSLLNCEGIRDSVNVIVNPTPLAPIVTSPIIYCQNDASSALTATKAFATDTLNWYTVATGGTRSLSAPIPGTASSGTTTYYVSLKNNSACEGPRSAIIVSVNPAPLTPIVTTPIEYCEASVALPLSATGTLLKWYNTASGGVGTSITPTPSTALSGTTIYYVSQTNPSTGCEGARSAISVTINPLPLAPVVISPLNLCIGGSSAAIGAVGTGLKWYTVASGGIPSSTAPSATTSTIGTTNYYVSQTSSKGCEGPRALLVVIVNPLPVVTISSLSVSGFVYCRGESTTLKANSSKAVSYQWEFAGKVKSGAVYDTIAADSTGKWGVTVFDKYGCAAKSEVDVREDTSALPVLSPTEILKCEEGSILLTCHPGFAGYTFELYQDGLPASPGTIKENIKTISDSGVYFVVVTNSYGCVDTTNNSYVDYYPKPPKPIVTLSGTLLETIGVYRYYQWYKNDKPIIGAHAKKYTTTGKGYYFLEITDANGCLNQSDTVFVSNATGIGNANVQQQLKLYPNPTKDRIIIESPIKVNIQVLNMVGQVMIELIDAHIVDLSNYADGTYVFRISDQDNQMIGIEKVTKLTTE
ncbi:MAG: T9SS type A sorting domain-containing protein [Bacteroidota bacterium]